MEKFKNEVKWKVIDDLLEKTDSTPRELLDWLEWGFENVEQGAFICNEAEYKNKYYIADTVSFLREDETIIKIGVIITGGAEPYYPSAVWGKLLTDMHFREVMIARFKKHYKLK